MKLRNVLFITIILIVGCLSNDLMAQDALKAMIKKCESLDNVEMSVVRKKNKETLKVEQSITTITINVSNKALIDEFIAACEKDEPSAYEVIYSKKKGKVIPQFFRFKNVNFSFSYNNNNFNFTLDNGKYKTKKEETLNITMIEN
ncbi:MAG: DUF5024 domain-containing protein [Dysgonamonadaceae bacterium]|jgi:hypothetical protein|nr:DUF5024 domain-containing protein [Dysgonamonadaceae bacterium]